MPNDPAQFLAQRLLEVIPPLMHQIRTEVRVVAQDNLTVPQFRSLANIRRGVCTVGQIAEDQGISQPAASKIVEGLASRGILKRSPHPQDRRQVILQVTGPGNRLFEKVRALARARIAGRLSHLPAADHQKLEHALDQIEAVFAKAKDGGSR